MASSPEVTCSPAATTVSYSRASWSGAASRVQATSWLVVPAIAETTTATSWPAVDLALDVARDVPDAIDVGDGRPAEFHHQPCHRLAVAIPYPPEKGASS